jgi:hypothetical protein
VPLEPDLVVYYEGANSLAPRQTLKVPDRWIQERPRFTFRQPSRLEQYSALARRLTSLSVRFAAVDGREPAKGAYPLIWPPGVDEQHPDPDLSALPMGLAHVVRMFDAMRTAVESVGGEFGVASFVWMIPDPRTPLDLAKHRDLYLYLNRTLWPVSYAHLRRMTDFQNRVFAAYAEKHHAQYLELAASMPRDIDLFGDPIHMGEPGLRLQAWILLQQLVPWLASRLDDGRLPKPMRTIRAAHPELSGNARELVTVQAVKATCR